MPPRVIWKAPVSWQAITVQGTGHWSSSNVLWNDARAAYLDNVAAVCKVFRAPNAQTEKVGTASNVEHVPAGWYWDGWWLA
mmetsp:Transcript_63517/g.104155  ORF Transcript_63517/g.104155 Transcript_63517/m.104155 type:complete len:81 (+) Transcript_63517:364-606(+)